ncbi:MAG: hypothetical protein NXI31_15515 [bacterium]|nr:hypothetical protein [bacterium]
MIPSVPTPWARPGRCLWRPAVYARALALTLGALCAAPAVAQALTTSAGFAAIEVFAETMNPASVRGIARVTKGFVVARGRNLDLCRPYTPPRRLLQLGAGEAFGFLTATPAGNVLTSELYSGRIFELDPDSGQRLRSFVGPRLAFDAVMLPSGDVLTNANPTWPAPTAQCGIWLAGPGRPPRELLPLSGPSGPLALDPNGDLIVAELGPVVPPPPGTARLLRFSNTTLQHAIQNGVTLTTAQATASANGYDGLYDLAIDDHGRIHSTDPASPTITHTAPRSLAPNATTADAGAGRSGLWLHFEPGSGTTLTGYQPGEHSSRLFVAYSDFFQHFGIARVTPERPILTASRPLLPAHSTANLTLTNAPPGGTVLLLADAGHHRHEQPVAAPFGNPLWFGLPLTTAVVLAQPMVDASGRTTTTITNPGGFALPVTCQCAVLDAARTSATSSSLIHLQLQQ